MPSPPFGALLKEHRLEARLTQAELAERAQVSEHSISNLERGAQHAPRKDTIRLLSAALCLLPAEEALFRASARALRRPRALLGRRGVSGSPPPALADHPTSSSPLEDQPQERVGLWLLPAPTPCLTGRVTQLHDLAQQILASEYPARWALHGLPGVGKTALALALATTPEIQAHFPAGVLWGGLGARPNLLALLSRWGTALGMHPTTIASLTSVEAWSSALRQAIDQRHLLLVIDDVWTLEAGLSCQVGGPHCAYLFTTRSPEIALRLAGTGTIRVPELDAAAGGRLLGQLAPDVVAAEPEAARHLVQAVGGLPLALVLMGKYLHAEAYHQQPRRLQAALERLQQTTGRVRLTEPQGPLQTHPSLSAGTPLSLEASIGLSVTSLCGEAQAMLHTLAVFPPKPASFSEEAALTVSRGTLKTLDALVDAGLVESAAPARYYLHQTIVDYIRLQGTQPDVEERYLAWAVGWIDTHHQEEPLLEQELTLLLEALRRTGMDQPSARLIQGITTLAPFLLVRGLYAPAEELLQLALAAARALDDGVGQLKIVSHLSRIAQRRGDYCQAETLLQIGLSLASQQADPHSCSTFLMGLGYLQSLRGELPQAQETLEEALALARQGGNLETQAGILVNLGLVMEDRGHLDQATHQYQKARELAQHVHDPHAQCAALDGLTSTALRVSDYVHAEVYGQAAAALARQHGYRERLGGALTNLGIMALDQGRFEQAEDDFSEALRWARDLGHREGLCRALLNLSEVRLRRGYWAEAETTLKEALRLARQVDHWHYSCHALRLLGELQCQQGHWTLAEATFEEAITRARTTGYRWVLSALLRGWGDVQLARQQAEAAQTAFEEAGEIAREIESYELEAAACYGLARLMMSQGKLEQARELGQRSWQFYSKHGLYQAAEVQHWLAWLPSAAPQPGE